MRRNVQLLTVLSTLTLAVSALLAPAASALSGRGSLSPNASRKVTTLKLSATSLSTESTLPSGITLTLQKGFATFVGGARSLCTLVQEASPFDDQCPVTSEIGTGSETLTANPGLLGASGQVQLGFTFFLGAPRQAGCAATVYTVSNVRRNVSDELLRWPADSTVGDLCAHHGGVRLSFSTFPTYTYFTTGSTITVNLLSIKLGSATGAVTGPFKNPSSCPKARTWTGSLALAFSSSSVHLPLTFACK